MPNTWFGFFDTPSPHQENRSQNSFDTVPIFRCESLFSKYFFLLAKDAFKLTKFFNNFNFLFNSYDVFNFQKINDSFSYVKICEYSCDALNYEKYSLNWSHFKKTADFQLPGGRATFRSSCSDPCLIGQIRVGLIQDHQLLNISLTALSLQKNYIRSKFAGIKENKEEMCCWSCIPCKPEEIVIDSTTCVPCPTNYWPNITRSGTIFVYVV